MLISGESLMTSPQTGKAPETIVIESHRTACDGGGGTLGHPLVYLEMGEETRVQCPYCGRLFIRQGARGVHARQGLRDGTTAATRDA